jgi:hypothetical protein
MRAIAVVLALACGTASVRAADIELRAVRHGRSVRVADVARLGAKLVALVESCSVNSTAHAVSSETWARIAASDSFVHVAFTEPRRARLMGNDNRERDQRPIHAILLPLPEGRWPAHVLVRSGNDVLSFTKDDPLVLREVILERELDLLTVEPYKSLANLPRAP